MEDQKRLHDYKSFLFTWKFQNESLIAPHICSLSTLITANLIMSWKWFSHQKYNNQGSHERESNFVIKTRWALYFFFNNSSIISKLKSIKYSIIKFDVILLGKIFWSMEKRWNFRMFFFFQKRSFIKKKQEKDFLCQTTSKATNSITVIHGWHWVLLKSPLSYKWKSGHFWTITDYKCVVSPQLS